MRWELISLLSALLLRQIGGQLIKCSRPALFHSFVGGVECFSFFLGCIQRNPMNGRGGAAIVLGQRKGREHFQRPRRAQGMPSDVTSFVRK